jgi:glycosyltransferase involved in cell wall biosynthesis
MNVTAQKRVSIVAPFYNEEQGAPIYFARLFDVVKKLPAFSFELVCVDDGSQDNTLKLLLQHAASDPRIKVIELSRNFGKEAALTAGLNAAEGDAIIPIDSDLQDPPELIVSMIQAWQNGAEVVLARRVDRSSDSFLKRKSAEFFYKVHNCFSSVAIPENVGDFRLMDRVVVQALQQLPERQRFMKGLFAWVGFKTVTLDYVREARAAGTSKFSGWKLWNFALEGLTSFSTSPLKIWSYVGGFGAVISLLYALFVMLRTIVDGVDVPGYASLLVSVIFFGSVQLMGIGMLGEYIGRIYMESKQRPLYIVRKIHSHTHG